MGRINLIKGGRWIGEGETCHNDKPGRLGGRGKGEGKKGRRDQPQWLAGPGGGR